MNSALTTLFVMADAFHLGWMGATKRLFHLAKAFRELGFNAALLAGKMIDERVQAEIDKQFPGLVIRTHHTGAYPPLLDVAPLARRAWRALWKARGAEHYAARLSYGWAQVLDIDSVIRELESCALRPNLIWGVSAGYLSGGTAAERLAKTLPVPWILELQDPPWGCGLGPERAPICAEFERLLQTSARQIVTSESYRKRLLEKFAFDPEGIRTIHLTYDGELVERAVDSRAAEWCAVYAGSLQGGRSLAPLLRGLRKALNRDPQMNDLIRIEIAGIGPALNEAKEIARTLNVQSVVRIHGYVQGKQAEEMMQVASALVVLQTVETSRFQIPGKIFEYMRVGKPILAIMPECEAADILRRSGLGFIHAPQDIDGIADTLIKLWYDWRAGRSSVQMDREYVSQFSVKHLPEKLRPVLEGLL